MNWIERHWGEPWYSKAKKDILQLVRFVFLVLNGASYSAPKMHEYRERSAASECEEEWQVDGVNATNGGPGYLNIAAHYGLEDEMDIRGDSGGNVQSIDHEYLAYTTAAPSMKTVDILKFWEVWLCHHFF